MTTVPTVPTVPSAGTPTRLFVVTTPSSTIEAVQRTRRGTAPITITNTSGRALRARARLVAEDSAAAGWFSFGEGGAPAPTAATTPAAPVSPAAPAAPPATAHATAPTGAPPASSGAEVEWDMAADETRQLQVQFAAPATAPQGTYKGHIEVWSPENPATTLVPGPTISVTLPPPEPVRPTRWWLWLIPVVVVLVLVGAAFAWVQHDRDVQEQAAIATATAEAHGTATAEAATATAVAIGGASAAATATAQAQVNKYNGTWINSDKSNTQITRLEISSAGQTLTVKMRGKAVDVVTGTGGWAQKACTGGGECDLGKPASVPYAGDPLVAGVETVSAPKKLVHRLTITVTPDLKTLSAVDRVELDGSQLHTGGYSFTRESRGFGVKVTSPLEKLIGVGIGK